MPKRPTTKEFLARIGELEEKIGELGLQLAEVTEERDFYASEAMEAHETLAQIRKAIPITHFDPDEEDEEDEAEEPEDEQPAPRRSMRQKMADVRKLLPRLCGEWSPGTVIDYETRFLKALVGTRSESRQKAVIKAVHVLAEEGEEYPGLDTKPLLTAPQMRRFMKYEGKIKASRIALDYRLVWCRLNGTITILEFGHHTEYYSKEW